jgi:hypothetical protein
MQNFFLNFCGLAISKWEAGQQEFGEIFLLGIRARAVHRDIIISSEKGWDLVVKKSLPNSK